MSLTGNWKKEQEALRMKALELAVRTHEYGTADDSIILKIAGKYYKFMWDV